VGVLFALVKLTVCPSEFSQLKKQPTTITNKNKFLSN